MRDSLDGIIYTSFGTTIQKSIYLISGYNRTVPLASVRGLDRREILNLMQEYIVDFNVASFHAMPAVRVVQRSNYFPSITPTLLNPNVSYLGYLPLKRVYM